MSKLNWLEQYSAKAVEQGWDIFDTGDALQLQRIDDPELGEPVFIDDVDAWIFVWIMAEAGDPTCLAALEHLEHDSPEEHLQICRYCNGEQVVAE